jgi:hypothetical protein
MHFLVLLQVLCLVILFWFFSFRGTLLLVTLQFLCLVGATLSSEKYSFS